MKILLGVAGWAGAGKDSFADVLVREHSFVKIAFADPLREVAAAINPIVSASITEGCDGEQGIRYTRYNDALDFYGYNKAKFMFDGEVRRLLQVIGTEAGRRIIKDSLWIDMALDRAIQHERVVIADMRFYNEAMALIINDGWTVRVKRPGVEAANDHISEHDLDAWDFSTEIANDGTLEDLAVKADALMAEILGTA